MDESEKQQIEKSPKEPPNLMEPLLTREQACNYLGIQVDTFRKLTNNDSEFPARKIGGQWRCDAQELKNWVAKQPKTPKHRNSVDNVVDIKPRRGRPTLSGTRPKEKAAK